MSYRIESIELFVRETPPARMTFVLGGQVDSTADRMISPIGHVRLVLRDAEGHTTYGCSGDRLSVRWLDKRPGRDEGLKRRELVALLDRARAIYLASPEFDAPFDCWHACHKEILAAGRAQHQEDLTSSFASALMERALLDAFCRLHDRSLFEMIRDDRLGIRPEAVHPRLRGVRIASILPPRPRTRFYVRHTVGWSDPLVAGDLDELPEISRAHDGLPETLEDYVRTDGLTHFKVKIAGEPEGDLARLARVWNVVAGPDPVMITLDANESYADLAVFEEFVRRLEREQLGLFQHIPYIEQPLPRDLSLAPEAEKQIRAIARIKPLIIDEADDALDSFRRAYALGYIGTSHKNCKGFFKSLLNRALMAQLHAAGREAILSGEDLQNLPLVPLQQDYVSLSILDLEHCERNGHHYNYGLALLSDRERRSAAEHHPDLYVRRGDEWFLNIRDGAVECGSLQVPGFGVVDEPDWSAMTDMQTWVATRHPA